MTTSEVSRTDEAGFRASVPRTIGVFTILEVIGYRPGGDGCYAYAYVLSVEPNREYTRYCTHRLIRQDDHFNDDRIHWILEAGHYDFIERSDAWDDLVNRRG